MTTSCSEISLADFYSSNSDSNKSLTSISHQGPITSISLKPENSDIGGDNGEQILTSSMDWTVRLWDEGVPIHTFEDSMGSIFETKWSPAHPTVFASAEERGYLSIWNLNKSWHRPMFRKQIIPSCSLTALEYTMQGKGILVGSEDGQLIGCPLNPSVR